MQVLLEETFLSLSKSLFTRIATFAIEFFPEEDITKYFDSKVTK